MSAEPREGFGEDTNDTKYWKVVYMDHKEGVKREQLFDYLVVCSGTFVLFLTDPARFNVIVRRDFYKIPNY